MLDSLLLRIQDEFPETSEYSVQLSILGINNEYFEFYDGILSHLCIEDVEKVIKEQSRFYYIRIIGVDISYLNSMLKHAAGIVRRDICWFSKPSPPRLLYKASKVIEIEWSPATFSSHVSNARVLDSILYSVEIATTPLNINIIPEYHTIASQARLLQSSINDLNPATSYLFRLGISHNGIIHRSDSVMVKTEAAPPSAPSQPRLYNNSTHENNFAAPKTSLLLRWSDTDINGSDIIKYQVQMKQIYADGSIAPGDMNAAKKSNSSPGREKRRPPPFMVGRIKSSHHHNTVDNDKNEESISFIESDMNMSHDRSISSEWKTIYTNIASKCFLEAPQVGVAEWNIRVRSRNACGWSEYSDIFTANARSHPSLFQVLPDSQVVDESILTSMQMIFRSNYSSPDQDTCTDKDSVEDMSLDSGSQIKLPAIQSRSR